MIYKQEYIKVLTKLKQNYLKYLISLKYYKINASKLNLGI